MESVTVPKSAKTSLKKEPKPVEVNMSGNPWDTSGPVIATLPVPNDVIITKIIGDYTERDRKLWTFLIAAVWDDLEKQTVHEIHVTKINAVFTAMGGEKNTAWIWDCANRLTGTRAYWKTTGPDGKRLQGVAVLMSGAVTPDEARASGVLQFEIPRLLGEVIKKPCRFSRLRIHFMLGLSGKYAVTLYMLLESVANLQTPVLDVELSQLRQWLKVPDGKMEKWYDIKRFAIEPALKQINDNPQTAGFSVKMEKIKEGRAVDRVRFIITKTAERLNSEDAFQSKEITQPPLRLFSPSHIPLPTSAYEQAKKVSRGWDVYALEQEWREWLVTKEKPDYSAASFVAFCKKKGNP
jgi:hypothetical protein